MIAEQTVTELLEIAEELNLHFSTFGERLASEIPASDREPEPYPIQHSTLTALVDAANSWSVNIDNGLVNGVVFMDLKKAFDTTDRNIL